jgi:4-amino-4-deoxy-L-arabinose transferase-like glycosyltransferase
MARMVGQEVAQSRSRARLFASARHRIVLPSALRWLAYPEFWLILLVGAVLRLFNLDRALWLADQTMLVQLARVSVTRGLIPATGIPSSITTVNPPFSIYLLLPVAAFTNNPLAQTITLAIWNVLGLAVAYVVALYGFGRWIAVWSGLFFAVCPAAVWYSRYLWQQNFLPPFLGLWALTLVFALKGSGRRWLVPHIALLTICVLLHPTAVLLVPVTLATLWLSPRRPHIVEYALSAFIVAFLLMPTLLWELATNWYDLTFLRQYASVHPVYSLGVVKAFAALMGGPHSITLGAGTAYATLVPLFFVLAALTCILFSVGWFVLTAFLGREIMNRWSASGGRPSGWRARAGRALLVARQLRRDEHWPLSCVLWVWMTLPLVALIRHNTEVYPHYLLILYPGAFIVVGIGAVWIIRQGIAFSERLSRRVARGQARSTTGAFTRASLATAPFFLLISLSVGLIFQSALYTTDIDSPYYSAVAGYGYPLNSMLAALTTLNTLEQREGVEKTDILGTLDGTYHGDLAVILVDERPHRSALGSACLRLPGSGSALIVSEQSSLPSAQLLATLPNATQVGQIPLHGDEPALVYRVGPLARPPAGETAAGSVVFGGSNEPALRLEGAQRSAADLLLLRWTVLTGAGSDHPILGYHARIPDLASTTAPVSVEVTCSATQWSAGDTLFMWLHLPSHENIAGRTLEMTADETDYTIFSEVNLMWVSSIRGTLTSTRLEPSADAYVLPSL